MTDKTLTSINNKEAKNVSLSGAALKALLDSKIKLDKVLSELDAENYSDGYAKQLSVVVAEVQKNLRSYHLMAGVLLCEELSDIILQIENLQHVESSLHALSQYISEAESNSYDKPIQLLWPINNLRAIRHETLISETIFSLPDEFSAAKSDALVSVLPTPDLDFDGHGFYENFSAILQSLYRGDNQANDLNELSELSRGLIEKSSHEYAAIFWFCCSAFIANIKAAPQGLAPGTKHVLRQIDLVIKTFVVDADTPLLSVEGVESVEEIMCNMLCFIALQNLDDPIALKLEQKFEMRKSLQQIDALVTSDARADAILLESTIQSVYRLIAKTKLAIDAAADHDGISPERVLENFARLRDACAIVCSTAAPHAEKAFQSYSRFVTTGQPLSDRDVCATSLMLAERAMLSQFPNQLTTVNHGAGGLSHHDDAQLDELLVRELHAELRLLDRDEFTVDDEAAEISSDWLQAVLQNTMSGAAFLSDTFLYEELSQLQPNADALLAESRQPLVLQLSKSVVDYLAVYTQVEKRKSAEEEVHVCLVELQHTMKHETNPALTELVESNNSILQDLQGDIANDLMSGAEELEISNEVPKKLSDSNDIATNQAVADEQVEVQQSASVAFGSECNVQVDIIQHALDTALGSSGNLSPDKTVITALDNLQNSVDKAGLVSLLRLIEPLSQILVSAEKAGSTLSQSDTLLVQEAIVAITLGVDSLVNGKPMSALVSDVTERMTAVAIDGRHQLRGDYESAGLIDIFVEEAEDHLQRLFELFQRWRGAPHGGSRIHSDISRLLHTVKGSADTVGLGSVAVLVHHLESALVDVQKETGNTNPSVEFFDTALDAIESLSDDIDRIRNSEQVGDRSELITRLQGIANLQSDAAGGVATTAVHTLVQHSQIAPARRTPVSFDPSLSVSSSGRTPAFGSAKYFNALEVSERLLSRNSGDVHEVHEELRLQVAEMRSTLQSTKYLIANSQQSSVGGLDKSITESLSDLDAVQRSMSRLMGRAGTVDERQRLAMQGLSTLVATADRVSVDSIRVRMDSIVQKSADSLGKRVSFRFHGAELELERKLFSDLVGPLEQLLTNAVVHGIEGRVARSDSAKPDHGTVELSFKIIENNLVVNVVDDGAGINITEVRQKLASQPDVDSSTLQSDSGVLQHLVRQGVSTAQRADRASGRGVGLDVVLQQVFSHRGNFSVTTTAGLGTEFTISIPLVSVNLSVMVVENDSRHFALETAVLIDVQETASDAVSLLSMLGIQDESSVDEYAIINCRVNEQVLPVKVDSIVGQAALNFNPHDSVLSGIPWCAGCALLDGRDIVLLVDPQALVKHAPAVKPMSKKIQTDKARPSLTDKVPEVLIVDDSVTIRASFGRAMKTAGYGIKLARNGVEAIEILKKSIPAVIILDLEMPEMNGFDLAAFIRSEERLDRAMLLVVTSRPRKEIEDWLVSVGAVGYFEKPCTEQILAEAVAALL